jgi:TolB-like protein
MIGKAISHYKILEKLGSGGMGTVYKAQDTKLDRIVALKFLPPHLSQAEEEKKRFIHEAKTASALDHPNICTIYEINETDDEQLYIVMACYEGESLKDKIERGPLPFEEAIGIAMQVARGLEKAHSKKIVHRDIKPANILITTDEQVKIVDFGLAKLAGRTVLTKEGTTLGTVAYMSPEQTQGSDVDERTDIWSFGVILYEMLTGKRPFTGEYEQAVIYSIMNEAPEPVTDLRSDVLPSLGQIVERALEKDPEKRYQKVGELLADLESISAGIVPEEIQARLRKAKLRKRKRSILYGITAGLLIAAVTVLILITRQAEAIDSIAVLPLKNLTGDAEQEYFVDGVTDELIGQLGQISGLKRVISRTSVMQYKETDKSLSEIARELNIDAVLEGTVYEAGDSVRIRFQLIDVLAEEQNLWGNTYKRAKSNVLVMYSEITQTVADIIQVGLTPEEETRMARMQQVNPEAYEAYLKGQFHLSKFTPQDLETALYYYDRALEQDPDFALAYAGISLDWAFRQQFGLAPPHEATPRAKEAALRALALDSTLAEVHYAHAIVKTWGEWDWEGAEIAFRKAIELNSNFPDVRVYYSHLLTILHRPEEAMIQMERTLELDPFNALFQSLYSAELYFMHRFDEAIEVCQNVLNTVPNNLLALSILQYAFHHKQLYDRSLEALKMKFRALSFPEGEDALTSGYDEAGYQGAMNSVAELFEELSRVTYILPTDIADMYAYAGDKDRTLAWLERGFEEQDPNIPYIGVSPLWVDLLGEDSRFQDLLWKMKLPELE